MYPSERRSQRLIEGFEQDSDPVFRTLVDAFRHQEEPLIMVTTQARDMVTAVGFSHKIDVLKNIQPELPSFSVSAVEKPLTEQPAVSTSVVTKPSPTRPATAPLIKPDPFAGKSMEEIYNLALQGRRHRIEAIRRLVTIQDEDTVGRIRALGMVATAAAEAINALNNIGSQAAREAIEKIVEKHWLTSAPVIASALNAWMDSRDLSVEWTYMERLFPALKFPWRISQLRSHVVDSPEDEALRLAYQRVDYAGLWGEGQSFADAWKVTSDSMARQRGVQLKPLAFS